jgi:hypothetical protein
MIKAKTGNARELLTSQELAVVVFTHGLHFCIHSNGSGDTGNWAIDPQSLDQVDKVIIYLRDERRGTNRLFMGNYAGLEDCPEKGRYRIRFSRLREVGTTSRPWFEFADGSQNPISIVEG